ncbi:hypothetical protein [Xanthomonas phage JGB6]|nr:hypothetical protein [Xanthomonas phage JGB6]
MGVKMITFLYRAMYNEVNKIFGKEEANRKLSQHVEEYRDKDGKISKRIVNDIGFNISGDSTYDDEGTPQGIWDHVPDEQASPESNVMEDQLMDFVHANISPEASAILCILESQNPFVTDQLIAYNRELKKKQCWVESGDSHSTWTLASCARCLASITQRLRCT